MKRVLSMLVLLAMLLALSAGAWAENTPAGQVKLMTEAESVWYYGEQGNKLANATTLNGDAVVMLSKTAESTGTENEFDVELTVSTTQNITEISSGSPDAATLLIIDISDTMSRCAICGEKDRDHSRLGHVEQTRLAAAAAKAKDLLDQFAAMGNGGNRYVSLVVFDRSASRKFDWMNVAGEENAANLGAAKRIIDGLTTGNGTNIEAGLMLGANVWNHSDVADIGYKYTILLTDGTPSSYVSSEDHTSRASISGTNANNYAVTEATVKDVGKEAQRILDLRGLSRLYSICFGQGVWNDTPFSNYPNAIPATTSDMTVLEWMEEFSTKAYKAEDATELYTAFDTIISQIILASQAWKVDDVMGEDIIYLGRDGVDEYNTIRFDDKTQTLHWDVLASEPKLVQEGPNGAQLTYQLNYRVKLDNLSTDYTAGAWTDTNKIAELTYAVYDQDTDQWVQVPQKAAFPKPQVKGYAGELTFNKVMIVDDEPVPLKDIVFGLTPVEDAETGDTWIGTATSDENGNVTFTGIPSGHNYWLEETNAEGYVDLGEIAVSVAWGAATSKDDKLRDGMVINRTSEQRVSLKLKKEFGSDEHPQRVTLLVENESGYSRPVHLSRENNWTETLGGLEPGAYTISESAQMDGYTLIQKAKFGEKENDQAELVLSNGTATVNLTPDEAESAETVYFTFENSYVRKTGGPVKVEKTFYERTQASIDGEPVLKELDSSLYVGVAIKIALIDEQGNRKEITLNSGNSWAGQIDNLPTGVYTIEEQFLGGNILNHEFVHMHLTVNDKESKTKQVEITEGDEISIKIENHYLHHMGHIRVEKIFAGVEQTLVPQDKVFYVDVYEQGYEESGVPVATIEIAKNEEGDWAGTSELIEVGTYVLKERDSADDMAIDGYTFVGHAFDSRTVVVHNGASPVFATLTNTYTRNTEALEISKIVDSPLRSDLSKAFTFTVKLDDETVAGVFNATVADGEKMFGTKVSFTAGETKVSLKHGETMTIADLPEGVAFTVTEESDENFVVTANSSNANAVAGSIGTDDASFVNTRVVGGAALTVSKTVTGTHASKDDVFTFEVSIPDLVDGVYGDMEFVYGVATVKLSHGQKAVAKGIPVGAAFTVTETDFGAYTPETVQYTGTLGAQGMEAAFVNELSVPVLPETGDNSRILLWGMMLAMAGAALMLLKRAKA